MAQIKAQGFENFLERDFKIAKITGPFAFVIDADGVSGDRSATTGWVTEVKKPIQMSFNSLRTSIEEPGEFVLTDFGKFERPATYHACFRSLYYFANKYGDLPNPHVNDGQGGPSFHHYKQILDSY